MRLRNYVIFLFSVLFVFSCTPKTEIFIQPSGDAIVTIDITAAAVMETLVKNVTQFSGNGNTESIFDVQEIREKLDGGNIQVLSMSTDSVAGIKTKLKIKNTGTHSDFVTVDIKNGLLLLKIAPENIREFSDTLSADDKEYLNLLMAPVLTGVDSSAFEYEELIKSAYGEKLAIELKKSSFKSVITCPKKIQSVKITPIGKIKKEAEKAFVEIPLSELLCLTEPVFAEVKFTP